MERFNIKKCFLVTSVLFALFLFVSLTEVNAYSNEEDSLIINESLKRCCELTNDDMRVMYDITNKVGVGTNLSRLDFNQDTIVDSNDATRILSINTGLGIGRELDDDEKSYVLKLVNETIDTDTILNAFGLPKKYLPNGFKVPNSNALCYGLQDKTLLGKVSEQLCEDYATILNISSKIGAREAFTPEEEACLSKLDVNMDGRIDASDISEFYMYRQLLCKATAYNIEEKVVKEVILSDFNNDNKIDSNDAMELMNIIIHNTEPVEGVKYDINGDGNVNILDVVNFNRNRFEILEMLKKSY